MKTFREKTKYYLDYEWLDAMARTGYWRMPNPKDNSMPFSNEQTIARAKVLFIEKLERDLGITTSTTIGEKK